jgi:hypothetical protein
MAKNVRWRDVLSPDLVGEIDDDINRQFAEGWRACQRATAALEPTRNISSSHRDEDGARPYPSDRAPRGFWSGLLEQEARERFPRELPLNEAMPTVQARTNEFKLARSSLNAAITTLEHKGRLRREGKKLFWIPTEGVAESTPSTSEAEPDQEPAITPFRLRLNDISAAGRR